MYQPLCYKFNFHRLSYISLTTILLVNFTEKKMRLIISKYVAEESQLRDADVGLSSRQLKS